jgi:HEAT repeat protein
MKKARWTAARTALACLVLLAFLAPVPGAAQDNRTLPTKVADILALFPAGSGADRDKLADQMIALGEPGLAEFTGRLTPAGGGADTAVRYAINAMAVYAARTGNEPRRVVAERALVTALGSATDVEVRTFLLSQLRIVGREPAVRAASRLLGDAALVEPATQLLLTVKGPLARTALAAALDTTQGPARITIVKAIGELGAVEANAKLNALAADPDPAMRRPVLASLARLASPRSYEALTDAAANAGFKYEPGNAVGALLQYASQLGRAGQAALGEKVCRLVMKNTDAPERLATRAAALATLADIRGPRALPELIAAVDHDDATYRKAALARAETFRSAAAIGQWVAKGEKSDPARRADIVAMLGRQGDRRALPFIRASMTSAEPEVALAAAEALARVEGPAANEALIGLLKNRPADAQRVADILMWTTDAKGLDPLAALLQSDDPAPKAAAVRVVGARGGARFAAQVLPLASDSNAAVRAAAYGALAGVAGPADLPTLLTLLDAAPEPALVRDAQRGIVSAIGRVEPAETRAKPLVSAMEGAAHPERLLEVLPQVGGRDALDALVARVEGASPELKGAAVRALVQWRGPEAAGRLFTIVSAGDMAYRDMAFGGFVRQVGMSSLPDEAKVQQLRRVLPLARSANERRMILRSLQRTKTLESFLVASSLMHDAEVANDAASAVMTIALPSPGEKNGLTGTQVHSALERVLEVLTGGESDYDKENIKRYLASMPSGGGLVASRELTAEEKAEGFVSLFDGSNLDQWIGNKTGYRIEDGILVFDPKAPDTSNIYTAKEYGDFAFRFEFQLTPGANSGVGIRTPPNGDAAYVGMEIQILDNDAPVYAKLEPYQYHGSVYGIIPAKRGALKPVGEWNTEEIFIQGSRIRVTVNGQVIVDGDLADATKNGTLDHKDHPGLQRTSGHIGFLSHGAVVKFRNIRIEDLAK